MITTDTDGCLTLCNDKVLDMFGYSRDDVIGKRIDIFLHPDFRESMMKAFMESISAGHANPDGYEMVGMRKAGSTFYFHLTSTVIISDGKITGIQSHIRDISDWKRAEEQLKHQKEELSRFANVMAHDLRSSIHIIEGLASCLQEEHNPEYAKDIIEAAEKIESLLSKSVTLADAGSVIGSKTLIDVGELIKEVATTTLPDNVKLKQDIIPFVRCDKDKMMQVFQNILQNAHEHGQASQIEVSSSKDDTNLVIMLRNDGLPIPLENRDRIFNSEFTTKEGGGLGLSIVKRIVEAHGWTVSLEVEPQTMFKILIPSSDLV